MIEKPQEAVPDLSLTTNTSRKDRKALGTTTNFNMAGEKFKAILILLSASLGIGCLGIPSSVAEMGIGPWFVVILCVAGFYHLSYYVILKLCDHFQVFTVSELGAAILGSRSCTIDFLFVMTNMAGYLACLITLNEDMPLLMRLFSHHPLMRVLQFSDYAWIYISTIITISIVTLIPVEKLHNVTFVSALSSICLVLFVASGAWTRGIDDGLADALKTVDLSAKWHVFMFLGFAFLCQQNLMTMYQASNIRNFADVVSTIRIFTVVMIGIYVLIGVFGYITFFDTPALKRSNILELYHTNSGFYALTLMLVNLNIQISNAVVLYPIREIIMEYVYGPKPARVQQAALSQAAAMTVEMEKRTSVFFRPEGVRRKEEGNGRVNSSFDWSTIKKPLQMPPQLRSPRTKGAFDSSDESVNDSLGEGGVNECPEKHNSLKGFSGEKKIRKKNEGTMSVRSIPMNHDSVYQDLVMSELGFFRNYSNVMVIIGVLLPLLSGLTAHVLVILNVRFYDAVDIVSKIFLPVLFFYLPMLGYMYVFKSYWLILPMCVFMFINVAVFF